MPLYRSGVQAAYSADYCARRQVTKLAKADYWNDVFSRYGKRRPHERFFLVAELPAREVGPRVVGFIIGEISAWESAPRRTDGYCAVSRT
jgi:hypothetical protein